MEKIDEIIEKIKNGWISDAIIFQIIFALFGVVVFACGFAAKTSLSLRNMLFGLFCMMLSMAIYALRDINKRILLVLFEGTFFIFLVGRVFIEFFGTRYSIRGFNFEVSSHICIALFLSVVFLYLGYASFEKIFEKRNFLKNEYKGKNEAVIPLLRKYAKIFYIIGFLVNFVLVGEQAIYVLKYSYLQYVKDFSSIFPSVVRWVANMRTVAFYLYLATLPPKKECRKYLILYIMEGVLTLTYGDRGAFALNLVFAVFYIFLRQYNEPQEKWIYGKQILVGICLIPFLFAFLSFFISFREKNTDIGEKTVTSQIVRFFKSMGDSVRIVGYGKQYEACIPSDRLYTIGDITQYAKYNPITSQLLGYEKLPYYTREYGEKTASFAHIISYTVKPLEYLNGHGEGSSYVAEAYQDFGYIGICVINAMLGIFMALFNKIYKIHPILTAALFMSFHIMFFIPRASLDYLITYIFNLTAIGGTIVILGCCYLENKLGKERKQSIE